MWGSSRRQQRRVLLLAVAFVLIQAYVLYASTFHVFHHMMPMCPACVALKSYQGSIVDNSTIELDHFKFFIEEFSFSPQITFLTVSAFHPRAPPFFTSTLVDSWS